MNSSRPLSRALLPLCAALALAACATPEPPKPAAPAPVAAPAPAPEPAPAAAPVAPAVPEGPAPGSPAARTQATQLLRQALEHLNDGNEDTAKDEIDRALALDPGNRLGTCLQKGMTADPVATLGRESTTYTVRPGDTLGSIATRALGEGCEFYLLARYNGIKVPKQLAAGQTLRIPGRTPLAAPTAATASTPAAAASAPAAAPAAAEAPAAAATSAASISSMRGSVAAAERQARIDRHTRNATNAFRRQDLATAIKEWDIVLELDPSNVSARARREEAVELQRRLRQVR